ncbi:hypothetical protein LLG95_09705 [bacterium]|nr:hypothetical protein [bacterium]
MARAIIFMFILFAFIISPSAMAARAEDRPTSHAAQRFIVFNDHATTQTGNEEPYPDEPARIKSVEIFQTRNADYRIVTNVSMQFQGGQTIGSRLEFSFTGVSGGDYVTNTSHTLFAINIKTNTMGGYAFVAAVLPTGDIILIKDLQSRLARAFKRSDADSVPNYVSKIEADRIYVSPWPNHYAGPFDKSIYVVRLDDDGCLKAVGIRKPEKGDD